jgi:hypothetical protein
MVANRPAGPDPALWIFSCIPPGSRRKAWGYSEPWLMNRHVTRHAVLLNPLPGRPLGRKCGGPRHPSDNLRLRWVVHMDNVPRGGITHLVGSPNVKGPTRVIRGWLTAHPISPRQGSSPKGAGVATSRRLKRRQWLRPVANVAMSTSGGYGGYVGTRSGHDVGTKWTSGLAWLIRELPA